MTINKIQQYYLDNKQKLQQKFQCICGKSYDNAHKSEHIKTNHHQNYIKNHIKSISIDDYNFLFECDSIALQPKTYPNIIISN